jgi:hypothetical protein
MWNLEKKDWGGKGREMGARYRIHTPPAAPVHRDKYTPKRERFPNYRHVFIYGLPNGCTVSEENTTEFATTAG